MKTLYLIDLDRTLLDLTNVEAVTREACRRMNVDYAATIEPRRQTEAKGESFQELRWIRDNLLQKDQYEAFTATVYALASETPLLYPDAAEFLEQMKARRMEYAIITYGDHDSQMLKIISAHLQATPYIICSDPHKGRLLTSWRRDGEYEVPTSQGIIPAQWLVLIDDKAVSFHELPEGCFGYLVRRPDEPVLASQKGEVPQTVRTIPALRNIFELEPA